MTQSLPDGSVVRNPPVFRPRFGRIPRAVELPCATTIKPDSRAQEPQLLNPHAATAEALVPQRPCSATRGALTMKTLHTKTRDPAEPKIKIFLNCVRKLEK